MKIFLRIVLIIFTLANLNLLGAPLQFDEVLERAKNFSLVKSPENLEKMHKLILENLDTHHLKDYFLKDEDYIFIRPKGLDLVERYLKRDQAEAWKDWNIHFCSLSELKDLIKSNATPSMSDRKVDYVILYRDNETYEDPHLCPIVLIHQYQELEIFIFDSLGFDEYLIEDMQNEVFSYLGEVKIDVIMSAVKRQKDLFSCSVFSYTDIRNLIELNFEKNTFLQKNLKSHAVLKEGSENFRLLTLDFLPPLLMRKTQSYSTIKYVNTLIPKDFFGVLVHRKSSDGQIISVQQGEVDYLDKLIVDHGYAVVDGANINFYTHRKWFDFIVMILSEINNFRN
ncbi:MAG: hypothetical protein AB8C84_01390 [Oligoflexales bacterium]